MSEVLLQRMINDLQELKDGQNKTFERLDRLEQAYENTNKRLDEMGDKPATAFGQTGRISDNYHELKHKLDQLIEDNKSISEILGEHEVYIRSLRRKPV